MIDKMFLLLTRHGPVKYILENFDTRIWKGLSSLAQLYLHWDDGTKVIYNNFIRQNGLYSNNQLCKLLWEQFAEKLEYLLICQSRDIQAVKLVWSRGFCIKTNLARLAIIAKLIFVFSSNWICPGKYCQIV